MSSAILHTITPTSHDLGGMMVRRALPAPRFGMVGPFIFVDQFGPAEFPADAALDIGPHPHIGIATVTWLFDGAIHHRDSLGTSAVIRPGQVNLMTAGRGITHSERTPDELKGQPKRIYGMQTWLALPDGLEDMAPAFESHADLPLVEDGCASARVIIGSLWGRTAPTTQHSPAIYADIVLAPGGAIPIDPAATERAVMLVGGGAELDGTPLTLFTLNLLNAGSTLRLSSETGGRVMLLGGEPLYTPRHIWWNFVSSSTERIRQAAADWQAGHFPPVPGDPGN
ncbi:pirin family protein [Novosphingobium sp.]|uniref:pirin family protein n=1 Tax=Novosphingobium sp. TaxID=1874826 RepID=UPI0035B39F5D